MISPVSVRVETSACAAGAPSALLAIACSAAACSSGSSVE